MSADFAAAPSAAESTITALPTDRIPHDRFLAGNPSLPQEVSAVDASSLPSTSTPSSNTLPPPESPSRRSTRRTEIPKPQFPSQPEYLQPSEFYPLSNHSNTVPPPPPLPGQFLSPENDKLATRGIPIFRPTIEEFTDFESYVTRTVPWGQYSGIVKIIPPTDWTNTLPPIPASSLANVKIKSPIQQNMLGQAGLFRQTNVEKMKNRPLSIKEWFDKCNNPKFAGPGPKDVDVTLDRDSAAAKQKRAEEEAERKRKKMEMREKRQAAAARRESRRTASQAEAKIEESVNGEAEEEVHEEDQKMEEVATKAGQVASAEATTQEPEATDVPPLDPSSRHSPQSSPDPLAKTPESTSSVDPTLEWYQNLDLASAWLPKGTSTSDYTPEACAHLERKFWKTLGLGEPGWYGADLQGTLFPDPETPWNVAHLPNLLNRLGRELPGVNRPYLYFGMWRAAFAWHVEDMDLFSINYIHFGAPKFWYAIPQGQAEQFERTITSYFPREAGQCDQFLRHKAYVMSPTRLAKDGIHVNMLVHNQGEFVITFPRGYHAGWNMGFNCAESVNFALDSWVELGRRAKVCKCVSHSVRIDMDELMSDKEKAAQEAQMKTEQDLVAAIQAEKSRKRNMATADRPRKRAKHDSSTIHNDAHTSENGDGGCKMGPPQSLPPALSGLEKKRKTLSLDNAPRKPSIVSIPSTFPCILCPHQSVDDLLPVYQPADNVKAMCKSHDGVVRAHVICANSVPEVWIDQVDVEGRSETVVMNVNGIAKARWSLKCQSCNDKKLAAMGAKAQCVNGKCPRAFHVTCARDDEQVVYRLLEVEETVPGENGGEPIQQMVMKTDLLCPNHNPDVKEAKKLQALNELKNRVLSILPGQSVKIKLNRGSFEVKMVRVIEEEQKAEVQHENGQIVLVKWSEFDFKPVVAPKVVENEYAREYMYSRNADGKAVPVVPTPTTAASEISRPAPQPKPKAPKPRTAASTGKPKVVNTQHLSVNQMLNHPSQARQIPSKVVVCDSGYQYAKYPSGPLQSASRSNHRSQHSIDYQNGYHGKYEAQYAYPPANHGYAYQTPQPYYADQGHVAYAIPHHHYPTSEYPPETSYQPSVLQPVPARYQPPGSYVGGYHQSMPPAGPHVNGYSGLPPPLAMPQPVHRAPGQSHELPSQQPPLAGHVSHRPSPVTSVLLPPVSNSALEAPSTNGVGKIDLGLGRMERLMASLAPLRVPAIHLAGTNGKGSVSAMLEAALLASGIRVGRYNSPHLVEPRDAISLDGLPPHPRDYQTAMQRIKTISVQQSIEATTFEIATAAAFDLINAYNPDIMIIECGMGGVGDATNVIPPELVLATALTSVGLDHTAFLGETIEEITKVKAGIAVKGGVTLIAPQVYNGVARIARDVAQGNGSRVVIMDRCHVVNGREPVLDLNNSVALPRRRIRTMLESGKVFDSELGLAGDHQLDNASLAINLLFTIRNDPRALSIQPKLQHLSSQTIRHGIEHTTWKGRCDFLRLPGGLPVLVDGAHNADSATMLRRYLDSLNIVPKKRITWIIGLSDSKGKTPESVLEPLLRLRETVIAVNFAPVEGMPWVKPVDPGVIANIGKGLTKTNVMVKRDVREAVEEVSRWTKEERGLTVVAGSLYAVADLYRLLGSGSGSASGNAGGNGHR